MITSFWKEGHKPTLFAAFLYFDLAFMVWVLLGPLGPEVAKALHLDPAHKGLMVATPVLAGAVLRVFMGLMVDRLGPKLTGAIGQIVVITGLLIAWSLGIDSYDGVLALALVLGVAGASFAVALPLASRWYPAEHQGKAMGIAGMGNSGTVLAALFAPLLAKAFGWQCVFGLVTIPLVICLGVYLLLAKNPPNRPAPMKLAAYLAPLKTSDAWWFMLFYAVSFGGFSGLTASLSIYFHDLFSLTTVKAGWCSAACVFTGSFLRPFGGALADKVGGIKSLSLLYIGIAALLVLVSASPASFLLTLGLFIIVMGAFGMANGAVFQLVPQRFGNEIGVMTGLVGCAGGFGGFYLASSLGYAKQLTGSYQAGFLIFAAISLVALGVLTAIKAHWRATWGAQLKAVRI
ncbi:MAG: NarK/NasA family nitrate transporter [Alphaproteobacteria bacterium]|nr:NarK/NasA family nitrate transporter [Alphaproteobacteria bacterium]MDE2339713.1 NarK/NasA family nitrate transporter [Alphaproteobacteria bacterium]